MQKNPKYDNVVAEVLEYLAKKTGQLIDAGVDDVIVDPGFGFGKTVEHNYQLLRGLDQFRILGSPLLVGVSRKSMINRVLNTQPETALNGTTALHAWALEKGANILRVHDVKEAAQVVKLHHQMNTI